MEVDDQPTVTAAKTKTSSDTEHIEKVKKLLVNFVYDQAFNDFCTKDGHFNQSFFWFFKGCCTDDNLTNIASNKQLRSKIFLIYLFRQLSLYLNTHDIQLLKTITNCVFNTNTRRTLPLDFTKALEIICLKKMAYFCQNELTTPERDEFEEFIMNEGKIGETVLYTEYTDTQMYIELCECFKLYKLFQRNSLLSRLATSVDIDFDKLDEPDMSQAFLEFIEIRSRAMNEAENFNNYASPTRNDESRNEQPSIRNRLVATSEKHTQTTAQELFLLQQQQRASQQIKHHSPVVQQSHRHNPQKNADEQVESSILCENNHRNMGVGGDEDFEPQQHQHQDDDHVMILNISSSSEKENNLTQDKKLNQMTPKVVIEKLKIPINLDKSVKIQNPDDIPQQQQQMSGIEEEKDDEPVVVPKQTPHSAKRKSRIAKQLAELSGGDNTDNDDDGLLFDFNLTQNSKRKSKARQQYIPPVESVAAVVDDNEIKKTPKKRFSSATATASNLITLSASEDEPNLSLQQSRKTSKQAKTTARTSKNCQSSLGDGDSTCSPIIFPKIKKDKSTPSTATAAPKTEPTNSDDEEKYQFKRVKRNKWTENEILFLVHGAATIGVGSWSKILATYKSKFNEHRTSVDLKDKFRNLEKHPDEMKSYAIKCKNLKEKLSALAEKKKKNDLEDDDEDD